MQITRTISDLSLSAEEWELFTYEPALKRKSEACAKRLNKKFTQLVNEGRTRGEVEQAMHTFMAEQANIDAGAMDTEPRYQLDRLLKKVFAS